MITSKLGAFYNIGIATQSGTQRLAKIVAMPIILHELGRPEFAYVGLSIVRYMCELISESATCASLRNRFNEMRCAIADAPWQLPPSHTWAAYGRAGEREKRILRLQWWSYMKMVDECFHFGLLATGHSKLNSCQIPERDHQRDKSTAKDHSALRPELTMVSILQRSSWLTAASRVRVAAAVRVRDALELSTPLRDAARESMRQFVHERTGDQAQACYSSLRFRTQDGHDRHIRFLKRARFVVVTESGNERPLYVHGRVVAAFTVDNGDGFILLDTLCVPAAADDERFRRTRCRPMLANGSVRCIDVTMIVNLREIMVTDDAAGENAALPLHDVLIENGALFSAGRRMVYHTLWSHDALSVAFEQQQPPPPQQPQPPQQQQPPPPQQQVPDAPPQVASIEPAQQQPALQLQQPQQAVEQVE
jgi:hypothetical protein